MLVNGINSCNSLLHLQAAPVRIVAQVSLPSVLWMVSPTTVLEERPVGRPRPVTNSKQGTRGSVLLVLEEGGTGLQKCFLGQAREFDSKTPSADIFYMKA